MTTALPARHRRTHPAEFKAKLVAICRQPGISVSAVALAHGVNANLLRRWVKQFPVGIEFPVTPTPIKLVPVQIETLPDENIQFDIQRGATRIHIRWPVIEADACARWLGGWLK